jgi:hypothetical protein
MSATAPTPLHSVSRATYPLPQPLVLRLQGGGLQLAADRPRPAVESIPEALTQLVGNAIESMDAMYFATPPRLRKLAAFQHRLCLRIRANRTARTLSLTDLGSGMTRADIINTLGMGRAGMTVKSSHRSQQSNGSSRGDDRVVDTTDDEEWDDESEEEEDGEEEEDDDEEGEGEEEDEDTMHEEDDGEEGNPAAQMNGSHAQNGGSTPSMGEIPIENLSCRVVDIGGFYSALCTLGTGVRVGTKSKFDDYYEFEVGVLSESQSIEAAVKEFCIRRPREEGAVLSAEEGFDQFEDVRGESGTGVTIRLNEEAIAAGLLDEEKLKPIFLKIVETTQYTVAFSSDGEAEKIINASELEIKAAAEIKASEQEMDPLDAVADMKIDGPKREGVNSHRSVYERAKYIPLRLSLGERKMLRLVEASMICCDYTTEVDRTFKSSTRRTHEQLKGVTAILRGLVTACDYTAGQKLLGDDDYTEYETFFRQMFEIARRHKIMNPEKMRTEYGKLIYLLQDAVSPSVKPHLGFSVKGPIETVYKFLEERGGLGLLKDALIERATEEILALNKTRSMIDKEIRLKERAVATLKQKYRNSKLSSDDVHLCLYSICDNNSFLNSNRVPVDKIIDYLTTHFSPSELEEGYSLSIVSGEDGARLSHSHERQYDFALQSLTLWRDIIDDMFRLWAMGEEDLLNDSVTYSLQDTGQGMQRVQQCPRTYQAMQKILSRVQAKVRNWIGSSVIHMGDHNVPNALSFIDKYTQGKCIRSDKETTVSIDSSHVFFVLIPLVPRILAPIVSCLENLEKICDKDDGIRKMVDVGFGGVEKLRKDILYDFFRSAFDGSGADNFYDAGSCIDGRMTSAWNWCSQLQFKDYYPIFKLTGFIGFDGEFK